MSVINSNIKKLWIIPVIVLMLVGLFTFESVKAGSYPVTVVDDLDQEITLQEKPERIVSMAPSLTEMLFAIGLGDKVVGVTDYADYPEEATKKDKIGNITEPNIEKIVAMEPDLVLAAAVNKMKTVERLQELGIKVAGFDPNSVKETIEVINKVGKLSGERIKASNIAADMSRKLKEIEKLTEEKLKEEEKPKVFYEIWSDPLTTAGEGTFIDDMIKRAGGINIGDEAQGSWPQYSLEKLLVEDPDVYISSPHSAPHQVTPETIKDRENFSSLEAIKNDRIYIVNQNLVSRPSPRLIKGLKAFVSAIFPELEDDLGDI